MKKHPLNRCLIIVLCVLSLSCSRTELRLFDAIPRDAEAVLETTNPEGFLKELKGKPYVDPFMKADADVAWVGNMAMCIDSMMQSDENLHRGFLNARMALSSVPVDEEWHGLLLAMPQEKMTEADLKRFFKNHDIDCEFRKNGQAQCYYLKNLDSLYVFAAGPFVGLCRDMDVVEKVFHQMNDSEKIDSDGDLVRLQKTLGQHVKAHLYYRDNRGWAALDVIPGQDEVTMNGYCLAADTASSLRPLKYQLPVKNSIVNILPYDTRLMLHYGMSDYASYWQAFRDAKAVEALNKRYGIDVENQLLNYLSEVSYDIIGDKRQEVFVGRMNDPSAVIKFMDRLTAKMGGGNTLDCQGYVICDLGEKDFVPVVFGGSFKTIKRYCYAIVDQYLVITTTVTALKDIIACYRSGRTLDLNENFKTFQQRMLESCNITLFVTGKGNQPLVNSLAGGAVSRYLDAHPKLLDDFQALSLQLASSKDLVYANLSLMQNATTQDESIVRWKVNLDAPLNGKPYIVDDGRNDNRCVIAFDRQNVMYMINSEGKILWQKNLEEAPISEVFAIDKDNNGQLQLLFNTAHTMQLIDRDGANVEGFPVRFPFEASNGMAVIDYDNSKSYRILVCGTDRLVYNYDLDGEEVEGWNHHRAEDLVRQPVQHIVAADKDYLIVSDVSGGVRILDRQGRIRIPLSSEMQKSPKADIYANLTNRSKGLFLTSDKDGKLLYVTPDGVLNRTDFGNYSDKHFFLYEDFNGDKDPDFIYLDQKELHIFDRFKTELFAYQFDTEITAKPVFFNITRNKRLLGIVSEKNREIYLIDRKGKMIVNSGLVGETPFAVGSLHNNQEINLVTGVGNALYNYVIH
ncbi:MAG: hypothetical protein IKM95_02995 [Bacteroidales bacterium]|nr:hypothetical protein [Bacteroidales bacterium]